MPGANYHAAVTVLRARPFRSVHLERDEGGAPVVVKRFHHPSALLALFDGRRARREFEALSALAEAGVPVPRPLGVRRTPAGWEVRLAPVAGARSLRELLDGAAAPPGGWERLCARLGRALAALQVAGWEHGDLHPGNVLVDPAGAPWLIDLQSARRVRSPDAGAALAAVVRCAAVGRETLAPRPRQRFLLAWLAALPSGLRPASPPAALAREVEALARVVRRDLVTAGLGRWLRESSRVHTIALDGGSALVRADLDADPLAAPADERRFLVLRGEPHELRARWLAAARLHEHGVPVARPAALRLGPGRAGLAAFERPAAGAPTVEALLGALEDRGLALAEPREPFAAGPGGLYCLPPRELVERVLTA
jgi:hypothetical protein